MKKLLSGIIIGAILTTSVSAIAASNRVNMEAVYSVNKLVVDGVDTGKGKTAFVSNGVTYVPLRTVSDALGNEISWDSSTKTIYINSSKNNNTNTNNGEPTDIPPVSNTPSNATTSQKPTNNNTKLISKSKAQQVALNAVGGGSVIWSKDDIYDNDDRPDYEFKIKKGTQIYEVEVDAISGTVRDFDIDD